MISPEIGISTAGVSKYFEIFHNGPWDHSRYTLFFKKCHASTRVRVQPRPRVLARQIGIQKDPGDEFGLLWTLRPLPHVSGYF